MTTIPSAPLSATRINAASINADKAADSAADPGDRVGKGSGSARAFGGIVGGAIGVGALMGITALASKSNAMPVRIAELVGGLGAIGGGAYFGQKLLGNATRATSAEADRAASAQVEARSIDFRATEAKYRGRIDDKQLEQVNKLRDERTDLAEAKPDQAAWAKWVLPIALGVGAAALGGYLAMKFSPDDGKGITAMFNTMGAIPAGGALGAWGGTVLGNAIAPGERFAQVPGASAERIKAIDAELETLIGADAA